MEITDRFFVDDSIYNQLNEYKRNVRDMERLLGRKINSIDIIGELEVSRLLNLSMVRKGNQAGFDAYDNELKVQIKASRGATTSYRLSTLLKKDNRLDFHYAVFIWYNQDFKIKGIYRASQQSIAQFFDYINSAEMRAKREKDGISKLKTDISISDFIRHAESIYDTNSQTIRG